MQFSSLPLDPDVLTAIDQTGYKNPTPIQSKAIPRIIKGSDIVGIAQTGTGKTAAFTLPILTLLNKRKPKSPGIRALILAPTRELVSQIHENMSNYGHLLPIKVTAIYGGVGENPQIDALKNGAEVVIATPGRLIDLMDQGHVHLSGAEFLVLDEADRMLDMGFLSPIRKIVRKLPKARQTLLFSATFSHQIEMLSKEFLDNPQTVEIGKRTNPADTVNQSVHEVPRHLKYPLLKHLLEDHAFYSVLIFCSMKHFSDRLARQLRKDGYEAEAIHGDRTQNQRQRALDKFKEGKVRLLVATDVAARGIDISGVTHVINFDFPIQMEDYIHRIGRTGRAGEKGEALTFVQHEERRKLTQLEKHIKHTLKVVQAKGFDYYTPAPEPKESDRKKKPSAKKRNGQRRPKR